MKLSIIIFLFCYFQSGQAIIGGAEIPIHRVPYQVNCVCQTTEKDSVPFAGIIVSQNLILTHAYFVNACTYKSCHAGSSIAGKGDWLKLANGGAVTHPKYEPKNNRWPIALFRTHSRISFTQFVQPAPLVMEDDLDYPKANATDFASGYGSNYGKNATHNVRLRVVRLPVHNLVVQGQPEMYWIGYSKRKVDKTTRGDEGGPVFSESRVVHGMIANSNPGHYNGNFERVPNPQKVFMLRLARQWIDDMRIKYAIP